jgi:translation initiation factor IF-3
MRKLRINKEITSRDVRLVKEDKTAVIMPLEEALQMAIDSQKDLVEIYPDVNPPVCKIINYEKFLYKTQKEEKEIKKKHKISVLKEMQFSLTIGPGDYKVKLAKVIEFIQEGNKVQFSIMLKKRQMNIWDTAQGMLHNIVKDLGDLVKVEKAPYQEKKKVMAIIAPQGKKKTTVGQSSKEKNSELQSIDEEKTEIIQPEPNDE